MACLIDLSGHNVRRCSFDDLLWCVAGVEGDVNVLILHVVDDWLLIMDKFDNK